ncbi:hypothetical protein GGX14DRAFT_674620 [Mycena pura]|uniref:Uncharacterized protein n=1 Tax=Mycena pura TaxID=153505 RepID=A0AAD6Y0R7_9AGAR|nr:hypothetical protein GGX14DRAFT_674620 [Mycena pura]
MQSRHRLELRAAVGTKRIESGHSGTGARVCRGWIACNGEGTCKPQTASGWRDPLCASSSSRTCERSLLKAGNPLSGRAGQRLKLDNHIGSFGSIVVRVDPRWWTLVRAGARWYCKGIPVPNVSRSLLQLGALLVVSNKVFAVTDHTPDFKVDGFVGLAVRDTEEASQRRRRRQACVRGAVRRQQRGRMYTTCPVPASSAWPSGDAVEVAHAWGATAGPEWYGGGVKGSALRQHVRVWGQRRRRSTTNGSSGSAGVRSTCMCGGGGVTPSSSDAATSEPRPHNARAPAETEKGQRGLSENAFILFRCHDHAALGASLPDSAALSTSAPASLVDAPNSSDSGKMACQVDLSKTIFVQWRALLAEERAKWRGPRTPAQKRARRAPHQRRAAAQAALASPSPRSMSMPLYQAIQIPNLYLGTGVPPVPKTSHLAGICRLSARRSTLRRPSRSRTFVHDVPAIRQRAVARGHRRRPARAPALARIEPLRLGPVLALHACGTGFAPAYPTQHAHAALSPGSLLEAAYTGADGAGVWGSNPWAGFDGSVPPSSFAPGDFGLAGIPEIGWALGDCVFPASSPSGGDEAHSYMGPTYYVGKTNFCSRRVARAYGTTTGCNTLLDTCQDSRAFHLALGSTYGDITESYLTRSLKRPQPLPADRRLRASYHHYTSEPPRKWSQRIPPPRVIAPKTSLSHVFQAHCTATLAALYLVCSGGIGLDVQPNLGSTYSRATRPAALPGDSELFRGAV